MYRLVGTEKNTTYRDYAMLEKRNKSFSENTRRVWKQTGTGQQMRHLLPIILVILLSQLVIGCTTHSEQSADAAVSSNARLVDLENGLCQDTRTGKMWQVGNSKTIKSLAEAKSYTEKLEVGGYHDWRLPSITELYELYIIFDLHENGNCKLAAEGTYWSDEPDLQGRVGTWELDDNCDAERQYIPKTKGKVRAIRN